MTTPAVQIAHIQSCTCLPELRSYWMMLKTLQPSMAQDSDVLAAKEARRHLLLEEKRYVEQMRIHRKSGR